MQAPPRTPSLLGVIARALAWLIGTSVIVVGITVGLVVTLLFINVFIRLPDWMWEAGKWAAVIFGFFIVPPAIAQRGGWRSERMEGLGCWLLFLGPIGWFILFFWREFTNARDRYQADVYRWMIATGQIVPPPTDPPADQRT